MDELEDVASRPQIARKLRLTSNRTKRFLGELRDVAVMIEPVLKVYEHPIDPKDTMVVNLAIAANAHVITSRDRHLLALRDPSDPAGALFLANFAHIEVMTPTELLERLRAGCDV